MIRSSLTIKLRPGSRRQLGWVADARGVADYVVIREFLRGLLEAAVALDPGAPAPSPAVARSADGQVPGLTAWLGEEAAAPPRTSPLGR